MKDFTYRVIFRNRVPRRANKPRHIFLQINREGKLMQTIETKPTEIKVENITFLVSSHFKEQTGETIDQTLARIICQSSENVITMPI